MQSYLNIKASLDQFAFDGDLNLDSFLTLSDLKEMESSGIAKKMEKLKNEIADLHKGAEALQKIIDQKLAEDKSGKKVLNVEEMIQLNTTMTKKYVVPIYEKQHQLEECLIKLATRKVADKPANSVATMGAFKAKQIPAAVNPLAVSPSFSKGFVA